MCDKHLHMTKWGRSHMSDNVETPLRDASPPSSCRLKKKVAKIEADFRHIMETLGLDLTDHSFRKELQNV